MFHSISYSIARGVDKLINVDVYLPRYPPKPKVVIDAKEKVCKKISREIFEDSTLSTGKWMFYYQSQIFCLT